MINHKKQNKGFSFIELLIAMTIFSIVMLMVVQFMSTTSGAFRKTKKNLNIQTEAIQVTEQMSDILMQAAFVRVSSEDGNTYTVKMDGSSKKNERKVTTKGTGTVGFDFVSDNYGNYLITGDPFNMDKDVILNMDTYEVVDEKGKPYPFSKNNTKRDLDGSEDERKVTSFRFLSKSVPSEKEYVQPDYIYLEYREPSDTPDVEKPSDKMIHVLYQIEKDGDHKKIYMTKYTALISDDKKGFDYAKNRLVTQKAKGEGVLTVNLKDIYLTADVEGNAIQVNMLFEDKGYEYNAIKTINFRNSHVLTVRPQRLFKVK